MATPMRPPSRVWMRWRPRMKRGPMRVPNSSTGPVPTLSITLPALSTVCPALVRRSV